MFNEMLFGTNMNSYFYEWQEVSMMISNFCEAVKVSILTYFDVEHYHSVAACFPFYSFFLLFFLFSASTIFKIRESAYKEPLATLSTLPYQKGCILNFWRFIEYHKKYMMEYSEISGI